jgi:hypothetical protein
MKENFYKKLEDPRYQSLAIYILIFGIMLMAFGVSKINPRLVGHKFYWLTATALMLFYAVFSSIASFASKDSNKYWGISVSSFVALAAIAGFTAYFFSGISIYDAGSYSWLYKVITFVYLLFMSMVRFMKGIVEFAQKEEWSNPKLRNKNNR